MKHLLYREQQINCDLHTAWKFFSSPKNLVKITPKEMKFKIISMDENMQMYEGMEIDYIVSPVLSIPLKWKTRITQVERNKSFTDFQEKGPYKYWCHFHEFIPSKGGVLMKDTIQYELPFGIIGDLTNELMVKNKLKHIFDFRFKVIEKMFNSEK